MGNLVFQATLGGQVNLVGPNTASTYNINVPTVNGNLVTTGDTGTVTNTMLASSAYAIPGTIGSTTPNSGAFTTLAASGTITYSGLTASTALALDASKNVVSVTNTGSGNNVLATSPTLTTPNLGTPSAVTLTNATGLPISTGVSGLGTGVATALAVNVGTAGSPVVNGGALGTPSSGTLTNATGLPISTGVSGLGTNVATALGTAVGSAGAFVVNGGALGTPSSGTVTNLTGTASININGTVGATTPNTGSFTTLTSSGLFTSSGNYQEGVVTANTGTAYTISLTSGSVQILTLTGNCTFTFPTATAGQSFTLLLKQDATGSRTVTWAASVKWPGGTAPTITSTASKLDKYVFIADGTNWYGSTAGQNY